MFVEGMTKETRKKKTLLLKLFVNYIHLLDFLGEGIEYAGESKV